MNYSEIFQWLYWIQTTTKILRFFSLKGTVACDFLSGAFFRESSLPLDLDSKTDFILEWRRSPQVASRAAERQPRVRSTARAPQTMK